MIKDYTIELNNTKIPNIMEITVALESPKDGMGMKTENTFAATVSVKRNASENAITKVFALATNKDGKKFLFDGKLEFISDDGQKPYKFDLKSMYVSRWTLSNPSSASSPTEETFELKVGRMIFEGQTKDGGTAKSEFDLPLFYGSK